ncbi:unnamed protein product [Meloidogyne enterolobii]|uniref:Uncharacterized protein n=1 Tax=Meloidogyne enterolobii TaxID=390850 RepID=A0ACB1AKB4_MELEN
MQIQLNGSTQLAELQHNNTTKQHLELLHLWLTLFHQIVILSKEEGGKDKSTNNKFLLEPSLAQQLVQLFLCIHGWPGDDVLQLLYKIMLDIETETVLLGDVLLGDEPSNISVVKIIIDHLLTNHEMASPDKLNMHLAELLFTLCSTPISSSKSTLPKERMSQLLSRQEELFRGVVDLLQHLTVQSSTDYMADSNEDWSRRDAKWMALSLLMWSSSCVIWRNSDPACSQYKQTLAMCSELSPKIILQLARLSLCDTNYFGTISNNSIYEHVWKASRWLLCSLARAQPELLDQLLDIYGFDESPIPENLMILAALSHICQSKPAINRLLNSCSFEIWIQKTVQICEQDR